MAITTNGSKVTTTKASKRGFPVTCPLCNDDSAQVLLDLADVHTCRCDGCGEEFDPFEVVAELRTRLERWEQVCEWLSLVPRKGD